MSVRRFSGLDAVAVYCGSATVSDPVYDSAARELARLLAGDGIRLVFGGSNIGTMKALADAMIAVGGKVTGIFTRSLDGETVHPALDETSIVKDLAERKAEMARRADALIALPGGFGTLDELFDAIANRRVANGGHRRPIGLLNVNGYYDKLLEFLDATSLVGYTSKADLGIVVTSSDPAALLAKLSELAEKALLPAAR